MERQRHNARGLPEDRSSATASSTSLDDRPPSTAPSTSAAQPPPPTTNTTATSQTSTAPNVLPVQNNMTTAGSGPLPAGWGRLSWQPQELGWDTD